MSIRVKPGEWKILLAIAGTIDLIQVIIALTGVGIAVSEIADIIIGILLVIYLFVFKGFSFAKHYSLFLSLIGVTFLEELTGGVAPAWILDIYFARRIALGEQPDTNSGPNMPLNREGVRKSTPRTPLNQASVRLPKGGLRA